MTIKARVNAGDLSSTNRRICPTVRNWNFCRSTPVIGSMKRRPASATMFDELQSPDDGKDGRALALTCRK